MIPDLNSLMFRTDDGVGRLPYDLSFGSHDGKIGVYFHDHERTLIGLIGAVDVVVGCVAWLTNEPILRALSGRKGVSIIVQKEDFLRPDTDARDGWRRHLRSLYDALPPLTRDYFRNDDDFLYQFSTLGDRTIESVRCVGNHNTERNPAAPRMHHKFIVFCRLDDVTVCDVTTRQEWSRQQVRPLAVWTGSFNFTKNATRSLENAVFISDPWVAECFYLEYQQVAGLSEPLDWTTPWADPEWRIGT